MFILFFYWSVINVATTGYKVILYNRMFYPGVLMINILPGILFFLMGDSYPFAGIFVLKYLKISDLIRISGAKIMILLKKVIFLRHFL